MEGKVQFLNFSIKKWLLEVPKVFEIIRLEGLNFR